MLIFGVYFACKPDSLLLLTDRSIKIFCYIRGYVYIRNTLCNYRSAVY